MALLTREQILAADDTGTEIVAVPEWGGEVQIRTLTGTELNAYQQQLMSNGDGTMNVHNMYASLCSRCICDEQKRPMFTTKDIIALGAKSSTALKRVFEAARRLNRIDEKAVETAEGNSEGSPSSDSTSG